MQTQDKEERKANEIEEPVSQSEEEGYSSLEEFFLDSCRAGDYDDVVSSLKEGVNVFWFDTNLNNALHMSCANGHLDVVRELLKYVSESHSPEEKKKFLNHQNCDGSTPLHWAVVNNKKEVVEELIKHNVDSQIKNASGKSPLDEAFFLDKFEITEILAPCTKADMEDYKDIDNYQVNEKVEDENLFDEEEQIKEENKTIYSAKTCTSRLKESFMNNIFKGLKNAVSNIGSGGEGGKSHHIAQKIQVGSRTVQEDKLLSEGGYGYIWKAHDVFTGEVFALKKMICQGPDRSQTARNELSILRTLPKHENIMKFIDGDIQNTQDGCIAYFLLEFCEGGSLFNLMEKYQDTKLSEKQLIFIMQEVAAGLKALHTQKPPIAHRDIKIENVLLHQKHFKLCDFGSCSSAQVDFSQIPRANYAQYEEQFEKNTTLMYRPPEMCDLYQQFYVGEKVDVWMLGCVLFTLCFYKHPFQESSKLAIVSASYSIPQDSKYSEKLHDFIRHMLTPNPAFRPSIFEICDLASKFFDLPSISLNKQAQEIKMKRQEQEREMNQLEKAASSKIRHFDGDIPFEELMKIQERIKNEGGPGSNKNAVKKKAPIPNPQRKPVESFPQGQAKFGNTSDWGSFQSSGASNPSWGQNWSNNFNFDWSQQSSGNTQGDFSFNNFSFPNAANTNAAIFQGRNDPSFGEFSTGNVASTTFNQFSQFEQQKAPIQQAQLNSQKDFWALSGQNIGVTPAVNNTQLSVTQPNLVFSGAKADPINNYNMMGFNSSMNPTATASFVQPGYTALSDNASDKLKPVPKTQNQEHEDLIGLGDFSSNQQTKGGNDLMNQLGQIQF